ncbi:MULTISPECIES: amidase [unclassified Halomonas]|uniref:amidase n=1 Tax=unclassified Halomonas TaxID=2609666 RepID=UPI002076A8E2|nr:MULTISPECIES: amidase [unclassified Halomonas]
MTVITSAVDLGQGGKRVVVKDTIDIEGLPTMAASAALAEIAPASRHADIVARTLQAGYHIVGKANLHELAFGMTGVNAWTGTPENPGYPDLVTGGSSSGSAAAVAAGLADIGIGTDTGGSIRVPAACCGVYGLKPTFGRLSREGIMPAVSSLDCVGPLTANLQDLIDFMAAVDPTFSVAPAGELGSLGVIDVDAESSILNGLGQQLDQAEAKQESVALPLMAEAFHAAMTVINRETYLACEALLGSGKIGDDVAKRLNAAASTSDTELAEAERVRHAFTAEVDRLLMRHDYLVLPTLPHFPMKASEALAGRQDLNISLFVRPFNLSGHPALSIPLPPYQGLPVSMQVIGRGGDDAGVCRASWQLMQQGMPLEATFKQGDKHAAVRR